MKMNVHKVVKQLELDEIFLINIIANLPKIMSQMLCTFLLY